VKNFLLRFPQPQRIIADNCPLPVLPWLEKTTRCEKLLATFGLKSPSKRRREFTGKNQQGVKAFLQRFATPPLSPEQDRHRKKIEQGVKKFLQRFTPVWPRVNHVHEIRQRLL